MIKQAVLFNYNMKCINLSSFQIQKQIVTNQRMKSQKIQQEQILLTYTNKLSSPIEVEDQMYCVSENGDILKIVNNNNKFHYQIQFTILGQPSSLCFRTYGNSFLISDFAHQSIFVRQNEENQPIKNLISEYDNHAFHGPNSIKIGNSSQCVYFTDSGPFLQTSIENCLGSLYVYRFEDKSLRALAHRNLAYPCGIQIEQDQNFILLCQMGKNRILKFLINQNWSGNYSVFHQFNGRFGPSSISYSEDIYYVSLFEFKELTNFGMIGMLNKEGELISKVILPVGPQITGIWMLSTLSLTGGSMCLVTQGNKLHRITFKGDRTQSRDQSSLLDKK